MLRHCRTSSSEVRKLKLGPIASALLEMRSTSQTMIRHCRHLIRGLRGRHRPPRGAAEVWALQHHLCGRLQSRENFLPADGRSCRTPLYIGNPCKLAHFLYQPVPACCPDKYSPASRRSLMLASRSRAYDDEHGLQPVRMPDI